MAAPREPVLRQRIFEARYERGYRYLDRCGEAMIILEELLTQVTGHLWLPAETVPTAARMICPDLDATLVFNAQNLVLDQAPVGNVEFDFAAAAAESLAVIVGRFGLDDMRRFGWRQIKLLPTGDLDEAEKLSVKYSPVPVWRQLTSDDLQPREVEQSYRFESADRARGLRISIRPFARHGVELHLDERLRLPPHHLPTGQREALIDQQRRKKKERADPDVGLSIDVDSYAMWPSMSLGVVEFANDARRAADLLEQNFLQAVRSIP